MKLNNEEMASVYGGGSWYIIGGIGTLLTYIIGIISGYTNPTQCNN